jgi:hypothetical protein
MSNELNITSEDLQVMKHGDRSPVTAGASLRASGWKAGVWVKYVEDENTASEYTVALSDGVYATGFLMYGSEDYSNARQSTYRNFTSYQQTGPLASASGAAVLTMVMGGGRFLFTQYERFNLDGNGNRTIPANYQLNENLKVSENGLLCNDGDAALLAKTGGAISLVVGVCCKTPSTDGKLGLDLKY